MKSILACTLLLLGLAFMTSCAHKEQTTPATSSSTTGYSGQDHRGLVDAKDVGPRQ